MYAILGINGNTGSVVAETLLAQGHAVRAIVRNAEQGARWQARGAEVAIADAADPTALAAALRGVKGAYLLVPPRVASADPDSENLVVIASLAQAVAAAKVPHVVLLSSAGAQHADGNGPIRWLHAAEEALAKVTSLTAIRAAYFQENWASVLAAPVLPTFLPANLAIPMVATADIGRTAAGALVEGGRGRHTIELAGPRDYSSADVAAILGKQVQEAPLDAVVPTFTGFGVSVASAELFREMYAGLASGRVAFEGAPTRGTQPIEQTLKAAS